MIRLASLKRELTSLGSPKKAKASAWFFKTGPGQYGEGDKFIGVTMPEQRRVAQRYRDLPLDDIERLLHSPEHEYRMTALIILTFQYAKGDESKRRLIYRLYLRNTKWINNWDLVDVSAPHIVGPWLDGQREKMSILKRLATSDSLWERRIAIIATQAYIKQGSSKEALAIANVLLKDSHDLIHKAVGWMLREVGKYCGSEALEAFLVKHVKRMPRTTLRYAIEHFPPERRKAYLQGTVGEPSR